MSALATNSDKPHPIGGRRGAWPGFKTRAWPQCRWAAARPGWASPSDTSAAGLEGTGVPEGTCRGTGGRRRSQDDTQTTSATRLETAAEPGQASRHGPGRGAGGRRQGLAGQRVDAPSEARGADDSRAGRRPPAHTAARPIKAGHAAAGNLAGQRAPPEIRRCHKPPSNGEASELLVVLRVLVGLAAVGSPERANRSHLFRRQREREDVEVLALALGVTGLGQGQSTELVVPA